MKYILFRRNAAEKMLAHMGAKHEKLRNLYGNIAEISILYFSSYIDEINNKISNLPESEQVSKNFQTLAKITAKLKNTMDELQAIELSYYTTDERYQQYQKSCSNLKKGEYRIILVKSAIGSGPDSPKITHASYMVVSKEDDKYKIQFCDRAPGFSKDPKSGAGAVSVIRNLGEQDLSEIMKHLAERAKGYETGYETSKSFFSYTTNNNGKREILGHECTIREDVLMKAYKGGFCTAANLKLAQCAIIQEEALKEPGKSKDYKFAKNIYKAFSYAQRLTALKKYEESSASQYEGEDKQDIIDQESANYEAKGRKLIGFTDREKQHLNPRAQVISTTQAASASNGGTIMTTFVDKVVSIAKENKYTDKKELDTFKNKLVDNLLTLDNDSLNVLRQVITNGLDNQQDFLKACAEHLKDNIKTQHEEFGKHIAQQIWKFFATIFYYPFDRAYDPNNDYTKGYAEIKKNQAPASFAVKVIEARETLNNRQNGI